MSSQNYEETVEIHAIVQGNVQGVGFRAAVTRHALRLGLVGNTRNLPDGTVEIFAKGKTEAVSRLFQELHREYGSNYISEIVQKEINPKHNYDSFRIIR